MDDLLPELEKPSRREKPHKRVVQWVDQYVRRETWLCVGGAVAAFLFGLAMLFITFWVWYGILGFVTMGLFPLSSWALKLGAGIVCGFLFVAQAITDRQELERIDVETDDRTRATIFLARVAGYGYLVPLASLKYASAYVKVLAVLLLIAPQSIAAGYKLARRAMQLREMDQDGCGRVLMQLLQADGKVTLNELGRSVSGVDWSTLLPTMREIIGVVFLFSDPPGMTLAPHLHDEITGRKG